MVDIANSPGKLILNHEIMTESIKPALLFPPSLNNQSALQPPRLKQAFWIWTDADPISSL